MNPGTHPRETPSGPQREKGSAGILPALPGILPGSSGNPKPDDRSGGKPAPDVAVIYGPGSEPVDRVRRITNASTGELGALLCAALAARGFRVTAFRGRGATFPHPPGLPSPAPFDTADELLAALRDLPARGAVAAVFHLAALPDFRVAEISGENGEPLPEGKIPGDTPGLRLLLRPATKAIDALRPLFPGALLIGWKYEVEGDAADAVARAARLLERADLDLCVANGPAYGSGFGMIGRGGARLAECPDKPSAAETLAGWLPAPAGRGGRAG